jgi:hypothetical protein
MISIFFFLAPPEHDESDGSPHNVRKDELIQFLRVCLK